MTIKSKMVELNLHEQSQPVIKRDTSEDINFDWLVLVVFRFSRVVDLLCRSKINNDIETVSQKSTKQDPLTHEFKSCCHTILVRRIIPLNGRSPRKHPAKRIILKQRSASLVKLC